MGQKLREDKIGALGQSSGTITMTASSASPAWLTIGGQQWKQVSNLSVAVPTATLADANTIRYIYAIRSGGNTSLVVSANVNSVGPAGAASWKLVGAFYFNGGPPTTIAVAQTTPLFGIFINIEGVPNFGSPIPSWYAMNSTSNVPPVKSTTRVSDEVKWLRNGKKASCWYAYRYDVAAGGSAGNGTYMYITPPNLTALLPNTADPGISFNGSGGLNHYTAGQIFSAGSQGENVIVQNYADGALTANLQNGFRLQIEREGVNNYQSNGMAAFGSETSMSLSFFCEYDVVGWSDTPLKDL